MFKISTMYKFWTNIPAQPSIYPAFKVVFLYFQKKMPRHKLGSFVQKISIEKNPMAEREPGSPPLPHGEPPGTPNLWDFLLAFFSNGGSGGNSKIFIFTPILGGNDPI